MQPRASQNDAFQKLPGKRQTRLKSQRAVQLPFVGFLLLVLWALETQPSLGPSGSQQSEALLHCVGGMGSTRQRVPAATGSLGTPRSHSLDLCLIFQEIKILWDTLTPLPEAFHDPCPARLAPRPTRQGFPATQNKHPWAHNAQCAHVCRAPSPRPGRCCWWSWARGKLPEARFESLPPLQCLTLLDTNVFVELDEPLPLSEQVGILRTGMGIMRIILILQGVFRRAWNNTGTEASEQIPLLPLLNRMLSLKSKRYLKTGVLSPSVPLVLEHRRGSQTSEWMSGMYALKDRSVHSYLLPCGVF